MIDGEITRILIVDDDQNLLISLCDILDYKGYETTHASNGTEALQKISEHEMDVALVDLRLEDMSGLELIRRIKSQFPFTECILLTGYATQNSAIEAISLGAFGYYQKPFEIEQVLLAIQQASAKSKSTRALAASERRLRALIAHGRDHIVVISVDGILLWGSSGIEEYWGYSTEVPDDLKKSSMIYPEDLSGLLAALQEIAKEPGSKKDLLFRLRIRNKDWRWVEGTAINLLEDPEIRGIVLNFRDITEQKLIQDNLRLHDSALEAAANAIVIADREGTIIWVNPAFESLTGYSRAEAIGQNPRFLKSGFQNILFYEDMWNSILEGKSWHNELRNKRKDGSHYYEEMKITPLLNDEGQVDYFIAIKQDISERKQFELNLASSEARYLSLFEDSPIAIKEEDFSVVKQKLDLLKRKGIKNWGSYFKNHPELIKQFIADIKISEVNQATLRLFGAESRSEFFESLLSVIPEDKLDGITQEVSRLADGEKLINFESINRKVNGDLVEVEVNISVPPGYEDTLSKVIVSLVDISERKKHEKAIEQRNQELDLLYTAG